MRSDWLNAPVHPLSPATRRYPHVQPGDSHAGSYNVYISLLAEHLFKGRWKRLICFIFRVVEHEARRRREIYNLRFASNEVKMMRYILTLASKLQQQEGGDCSGSMDETDCESSEDDSEQEYDEMDDEDHSETDDNDCETDGDTDSDEEDREDVEDGDNQTTDEPDFTLPSGSWLELSEALLQLSMMFWTHRDPAGDMSFSVLIHFTAVIGIQRHSLAYHSAYNSTSGLARLIWVG